MTLSLDEFLRRFLLHVLPKGFVRIRNFGVLANRRRVTLLPLCLQTLGTFPPALGGTRNLPSSASQSALALPQLWRIYGGRRETDRGPAATPFSTLFHWSGRMKLQFQAPVLAAPTSRRCCAPFLSANPLRLPSNSCIECAPAASVQGGWVLRAHPIQH